MCTYKSDNPKSVNTQMETGLDPKRAAVTLSGGEEQFLRPSFCSPASRGCVWKGEESLTSPGFIHLRL